MSTATLDENMAIKSVVVSQTPFFAWSLSAAAAGAAVSNLRRK
jgi:hypothetical protein